MIDPSLALTEMAPNSMPSGITPCIPFCAGLTTEYMRSCLDLSMVVTMA